jgi:pimeloyl-ACP methyl ester carboxylesterase
MYARVNGVQTWYDVRGEGEPLVLLDGGFSDSRDFEPNLEGLPGFPRPLCRPAGTDARRTCPDRCRWMR